eukprot:CAMPEP_0194286388 /NCGR_PEP_ID=MMETSP0169-20130528/32440_1 /TAXON_ID=218684 /ORGANISM="Corethron pennatum, Strain L29A3" /LENGTH=229 /DNA_ID=CAMNT_0039032803 /DNA_START=54 /DNA_END=743 /DNA_ORIENTATION=+
MDGWDAGISTDVAALTPQQRSLLLDGWMSPRMKKMLHLTAELEQGGFDDSAHLFRRGEPTALAECCGSFHRLEYIPLAVLQRDPRGIFRSFHDGYAFCFGAIAALLGRNQIPTPGRIEEEIVVNSHRYDYRKFRFYLDKGGRTEFALYAVIQITQNVMVNGDDGWEYDMFQSDIEALPASPMDRRFEAARFMCVERSGGVVQERTGPFREVTLYEGGGGDESEEEDHDY